SRSSVLLPSRCLRQRLGKRPHSEYRAGVSPDPEAPMQKRNAFLFDLDGTLVDSVYHHVLAWRDALDQTGIELSVWRIHRKIGMSGGLFVNALMRETGQAFSLDEAALLRKLHGESYRKRAAQAHVLPG